MKINSFLPRFAAIIIISMLVFVQNLHAQEIDAVTATNLIRNNAAQLNLSVSDLQNARISDAYADKQTSITMVYLQQTFKGIDVFNSIQSVAFKNNIFFSVSGTRIPDIEKRVNNKDGNAAITAVQAIRYAAADVQLAAPAFVVPLKTINEYKEIEFGDLGISSQNVITRLIWVQDHQTGKLMLSWQVEIQPVGKSDYWLINIDAAQGAVISKINLNISCNWTNPSQLLNHDHQRHALTTSDNGNFSADGVNAISSGVYRVIRFPAESPIHPGGTPSLHTDPWNLAGAGNLATTLKWNDNGRTSFANTTGNNVLAQEDVNGNNGTGKLGLSTTPVPNLTFDYLPDFTKDPTLNVNQQFALTNLFYWNNIMHDVSYQYGFTEAAGNFQTANGNRGGAGKDAVLADAQDGSGTNNANFSTPRDGIAPRMQMFLWSAPPSFMVNSPLSFSGLKSAAESAFSTANKLSAKGPITNNVVLFNDDASGTTHLACGAAANASSLVGKIALIERGTCNFTVKVKNAQIAGAIAAIVIDNVPGEFPFSMGGTDNTITIPAVMISYEDGETMKTLLAAATTVNVTMAAGVRIDGDLDNGIIAHEYAHGISNRLTGGPRKVTCLNNAEQMGEGWSDYIGLMVTTDWSTATINDGPVLRSIGTYALGQTTSGSGIRIYPYSTDITANPWTYAMMSETGGEVHNIGEVWCAMVWEMTWSIIQQTGSINANLYNAPGGGGNNIAFNLVMQGMKLQPCSPGFVDGRNAILKADTALYGGVHVAAIWSAFAKRGLGYYAKQGSSNNYTDGTADFSLPPAIPAYANAKGMFNAAQLNTSALLNWQNINLGGNGNFIIERSNNGSSFTRIGVVNTDAAAAVGKNYSYTDMNPLNGTNYYRLTRVKADGTAAYSEIRVVNFTRVTVSPNPAKDNINVTVAGNNKLLRVTLINEAGLQVKSFNMNGESMQASLPRTAPGSYYIKVTGDGITCTQKLIIQ